MNRHHVTPTSELTVCTIMSLWPYMGICLSPGSRASDFAGCAGAPMLRFPVSDSGDVK